jgi:hypothetical protein
MRVVTNVENPNPWMMMVPKFEIPPLGILAVRMLVHGHEMIHRQVTHTNTSKGKEDIKLIVQERFENLIRLEMLILDTCLILPQSLNGHATLFLAETARCDR